jgi:outer membrane protein
MNNRKIDLLNDIESLVNQAINEYAIRESYDLILYDNIAFVSDKIDITQEIILKLKNYKYENDTSRNCKFN